MTEASTPPVVSVLSPAADFKRCPFCKGNAEDVAGLVGCLKCGCGRRNAANWNHRPIEDEMAAALKELMMACERLMNPAMDHMGKVLAWSRADDIAYAKEVMARAKATESTP